MDNSNNVFVTGFSAGANGYDGRYGTVAYSTAGVPLWTNLYNGPRDGIGRDDGIGNAIAVDSNGNVFVTGESWNGDTALYDYATIKYSSAGAPLWTRRYGGGAYTTDVARAFAVDSSGNVFVTGSSDGINATVAYSNSGTLLWAKLYTSDNPYNEATGIALDRYGNVFVTGDGPDGWVTIKYSSSVPPPRLDFQKLNNQLVLSWTNANFNLQSAPFASGTFTNIPGATSPYTNSLTAPRQFFRLAQ